MTAKYTERYSPAAENPTRERSQADGRSALDRGTYGGTGHRSGQRRLADAFDIDTLEKSRTKAREVPACKRERVEPCTALMGLEPLHQIHRDAGRR